MAKRGEDPDEEHDRAEAQHPRRARQLEDGRRDRSGDRATEDRDQREPRVRQHQLVGVVDDRGHERALGDRMPLRQHEHRERERVQEELVDGAGHQQGEDRPPAEGGRDEQAAPAARPVEQGTEHRRDDRERRHREDEVQDDLAAGSRRRRAEEDRVGEGDRHEHVAAHADRVRERQP